MRKVLVLVIIIVAVGVLIGALLSIQFNSKKENSTNIISKTQTKLPTNSFVDFEINVNDTKAGMTLYIKPAVSVSGNDFSVYFIARDGTPYTADILGVSENLNEVNALVPYLMQPGEYVVYVIVNKDNLFYENFIENGNEGKLITVGGWPQPRKETTIQCPPDSTEYKFWIGGQEFKWCIKTNIK